MKRTVRRASGVRYDKHMEEFQLRCFVCAKRRVQCFWPLTLEFWSPHRGMGRCRACWMSDDRRKHRIAYETHPGVRLAKIEASRAAQMELLEGDPAHLKVIRAKRYLMRRERLLSDPVLMEAHLARAREASARYRAKKRAA